MPELLEVEHVRRTLEPVLIGRRVARVVVRRADVVEGPRGAHDLLEGGVVRELRRKGKQLAIIAEDGRAICVHLGMTGQLRYEGDEQPREERNHVHIIWNLADARADGRMVFRDPRRFGGVWTFGSLDELEESRWSAIGPDALMIESAELQEALGASRRTIKSALLDQRALAGVGNIYADEALFEAGVRPARVCRRIRSEEWERIARAVRSVLERAIAAGGSSIRDYVDGLGDAGAFQFQHRVYGRGGESCLRCGKRLRSASIAQRTTTWCPRCQR